MEQALQIEATETSPKVVFDLSKNIFEISGESMPENAGTFYAPIISWLDEFAKNLLALPDKKKEVTLKFSIEYMNSISLKFLFEILKKFEALSLNGYPVSIEWYYSDSDEDMKENGKEFSMLIKIPFRLISKP